jgi:hypothetical protein
VVLAVKLAGSGGRPIRNAVMKDANTAVFTFPVDVWFTGNKTYNAVLDLGGRKAEKIRLDPSCRFPDRDTEDNVWPRSKEAPGAAPAAGGRRGGPLCPAS